MNERDAVDTAMYSTLSGGTALITELGGTAIYNTYAPDGASLPYIVFNFQGGGLELVTSNDLWSAVYFVRCYASTQAKAMAVMKKADALLHKKNLSVSGYNSFWTVRETDMPPNVETGASPIYREGAFYRIRIS